MNSITKINNTSNFIRTKQIDSFQKLRFLLFLQQYPETKATCQEFATRLYLGNELLLEDIIIELQRVGLLVKAKHCWQLSDKPDDREELRHLARAFANPLTRQEILEQVEHGPAYSHYFQNMGILSRPAAVFIPNK